MLFLGASTLVCSTISIQKNAPSLDIHWRLLGIGFHKTYSVRDVKEVFVWGSQLKGTGLRLRLVSGKKRGLTRTAYSELQGQADLLNAYISAAKNQSR